MTEKDFEKMKRKREELMRMVVVYGPPERMRKPFGKKDVIEIAHLFHTSLIGIEFSHLNPIKV